MQPFNLKPGPLMIAAWWTIVKKEAISKYEQIYSQGNAGLIYAHWDQNKAQRGTESDNEKYSASINERAWVHELVCVGFMCARVIKNNSKTKNYMQVSLVWVFFSSHQVLWLDKKQTQRKNSVTGQTTGASWKRLDDASVWEVQRGPCRPLLAWPERRAQPPAGAPSGTAGSQNRTGQRAAPSLSWGPEAEPKPDVSVILREENGGSWHDWAWGLMWEASGPICPSERRGEKRRQKKLI